MLALPATIPAHAALGEKLAGAVPRQATPAGSGAVARTERIPIHERAEAAVIAGIRHQGRTGDDQPADEHLNGEDKYTNDLHRHVIWAMHRERGAAWLGNIHLSKACRGMPICWPWEPMDRVEPFSCDFVAPRLDDRLVQMIAARAGGGGLTDDADCLRIMEIVDGIAAAGGVLLHWT